MCDLTAIAEEIIGDSEGSFHLGTTEEYDKLSNDQQLEVMDMVWDEVEDCGICGWYWNKTSMEHFPDAGFMLCHGCESDYESEMEDEE